jgi:hypothetical protein
LSGERCAKSEVTGAAAEKVYASLTSARLMDREYDLSGLLQVFRDLARRLFKAESVEGGLTIDPGTGVPNGISGKITLCEPNATLRDQGFLTADRLMAYANIALKESGKQISLLLDRLDVAFAETHELERNALRALF